MADIVRIIIKGASGYGPVDEAYEDKIVITSSSISYEYKPHPESNSKRKFTGNGPTKRSVLCLKRYTIELLT